MTAKDVGMIARTARLLAAGAGFCGAATVVTYLAVITSQDEGGGITGAIAWWAAAMAVPTAAACAALVLPVRVAHAVLLGAALAFLVVGAISIWSVGVGLLVAAGLAFAAAVTADPSRRTCGWSSDR
jgi:hypothetical protein